MKVLHATDGSQYYAEAVRSVAERPWSSRTKFKVVSVIAPPELAIESMYALTEVIDRAEETKKAWAQEALSTAGKILRSAGLQSAGIALTGDPREQIIDEARKWEADLVVVGGQGRGGIDRILRGSVSEAVAIHAHCSVEVIHDRAHLPEAKAA
jgi:nucleotide-binding universal stress UspA family protein